MNTSLPCLYVRDMLNLGFVIDAGGRVINHRSLVKILLNPFLRRFLRKQIVTDMTSDVIENPRVKLIGSVNRGLTFAQECRSSWAYVLEDSWSIIRRRRFW